MLPLQFISPPVISTFPDSVYIPLVYELANFIVPPAISTVPLLLLFTIFIYGFWFSICPDVNLNVPSLFIPFA